MLNGVFRDFDAPGGPGLVGDMRRAQGYLGVRGTTVQIGEITINRLGDRRRANRA